MAAIKSENTKPEIEVRKYLFSQGKRFRLQRKDLPCKPDIILPRYKTVVMVHGCFWHRHKNCKYATFPGTNQAFWAKKFKENMARDVRNRQLLKQFGWNVIQIWSCEIKNPAKLLKINQYLDKILYEKPNS